MMLLTVSEVAKALKVNRNFVYKLIKDGELEAVRIGSIKVREEKLNEYINKNIIKQKIMDIYYQNGIMSKVTQNTIKSYFECKESGKINSFKLIKFKF